LTTQSLLKPFSAKQSIDKATTFGELGQFLASQLLKFAQIKGSGETLRKLVALNTFKPSPDLSAACAAFISDSEIISTLNTWSVHSKSSLELANLGSLIWSDPTLGKTLRPFLSDQLVSKKLRGSLSDHYLAALCASRRPIANRINSAFIQQLRALLLVRSFDSLHQGIVHEKKIAFASIEIRKACETTNDPRNKLLAGIANTESDFIDFCSAVAERCENELTKNALSGQERQFFNCLIVIARGGPWHASLQIGDLKTPSTWDLSIWQDQMTLSNPLLSLTWDELDETMPVNLRDDSGGSLRVIARPLEKVKPPQNDIQTVKWSDPKRG
jgi:hypothetical protein